MNSNINRDSKKISLGNLIAIFGIMITLLTTGIQLIYSFYQNGRIIYYGIPYFKIIQNDSKTWFFINILFILFCFFILFYMIRRNYLQKRKQNNAFTNLGMLCFTEIIFLSFIFLVYSNTSNLSLLQFIISSK